MLTYDERLAYALAAELRPLGLPALNLREHAAGMEAARRIGLGGYIDGLCAAWELGGFVRPEARRGKGAYHLAEGDYFILQGDGTPDAPFVVALPSYDLDVHAVFRNRHFRRFQVPCPGLVDATGEHLYTLAGPAPIGHNARIANPEYRTTAAQRQFERGDLGGKTKFRIDTDDLSPKSSADLLDLLLGRRSPRTAREFVVSPTHPHDPLLPNGALRPGCTPAQTATWALDVDVYGEEMTVWRVAKNLGLAGYVDRFVRVWEDVGFLSEEARKGMAPYSVEDVTDDYFVLNGDGTGESLSTLVNVTCAAVPPAPSPLSPDRPFTAVFKSYDERVRAVEYNRAFKRFSIPHRDNPQPEIKRFLLAGPSPIGHDGEKNRPLYRFTRSMTAFIEGTYGNSKPYCIDTAAPPHQPLRRSALVPEGVDLRRERVVWQFARPDPQTTPLQTVVENDYHPTPLDERGFLRPETTPATMVEWELTITKKDAQPVHWRLFFSCKYAGVVAYVRHFVDGGTAASLGKGTLTPGGRGAARVQVLQGW
ncbi:hypothetical protein JCM10449v2_004103 [Rhodotorula kratochvilovae]